MFGQLAETGLAAQQLRARCPEASGGRRDEVNAFAADIVKAFLELVDGVSPQSLVQIGVLEVDLLDVSPGLVAGGISDLEAAFGGAVEEVGGGMGQVLHVRVLLVELH